MLIFYNKLLKTWTNLGKVSVNFVDDPDCISYLAREYEDDKITFFCFNNLYISP